MQLIAITYIDDAETYKSERSIYVISPSLDVAMVWFRTHEKWRFRNLRIVQEEITILSDIKLEPNPKVELGFPPKLDDGIDLNSEGSGL